MEIKKLLSPPVSESDVAKLENHIGSTLPDDYRKFLLVNNGGIPDLPYFLLHDTGEGYSDSVVRYFFGISDKFNIDLSHNFNIYVKANRMPSNMLPIAADPGGNIIVLAVSGAERGSIYFWNHEMEGLTTDSPSMNSLIFINGSFVDFTNGLRAEPID